MGPLVYALCALTCLACTVLLWSRYRKSQVHLLFWGGLAFLAFTLTNVLLFVDLVLIPDRDLLVLRNALTLAGVGVLLYGLIHDHT
jgi:hypothetical protein